VGFVNVGTMTIGGQNTSGTNTFANPIILGWAPNRGKSVTLVAAAGGKVEFTGGVLRNGADASAGVTIGDASHAGTVRLAGANTYPGPTRVAYGTLLVSGTLPTGAVTVQNSTVLGGTGTLNGPVTVQSGGLLSPGDSFGALTINSSLTLATGSQVCMEINAGGGTSDSVKGLTSIAYAGTLLVSNISGTIRPGQTFQLFSGSGSSGVFNSISPSSPGTGMFWFFNPATGALTASAAYPTNITCSVNATNLTLSWPADHLGWTLAVQTNNPVSGLSLNANDWARIPGSQTNTQLTIAFDKAVATGFYRLVYP
jgi:autotransporter-associated beta strand protein